MKFKFQNIILIAFGLLFLFIHNSCGRVVETSSVPTVIGINGGISASGTVGSLFIINGNGFGNLSKQTGGYSVNFRDATTEAFVATASIDYAAGDWKDIFIKGTVPNLNDSTTYKVTVTTPGGTSNSVNFLVVASVSFSPSTITWTETSSLPQAQQGFPTVIAMIGTSNYIYALGGNTAASNVATVYYNVMDNTNGSLTNADWSTTTPLPAPRGFSAGVIANGFNSMISGNGFIYVLGGLDGSGSATNTVYYAALNPDGTIPSAGEAGTWATTTALPQALFAHGVVIFHGCIYVVGGNDVDGTPVSTVYSARIKSDGTLDSWQALPELPEARAYHQLVSVADYLYVIGGDNEAVDPIANQLSGAEQNTVYYNQIDLLDGSLVNPTWITNSNSLVKSREKHTAVAAGSYILVSGGLYGGQAGSREQSYATINSDGSVGNFQGATGSQTIAKTPGGYNFFNQSTAYFVDESGNPHVLILGGGDVVTGGLHKEVWYQH